MSVWNVVETIVDVVEAVFGLVVHWRFSLCLLIGILLAVAIAKQITREPLDTIVAGTVLIVSCLVGWCWEKTA